MKHLHFDLIDSTNKWAKENVPSWIHEPLTLVTASGQSHGKGRFNRQWISPPDVNIYATFCFCVEDKRTDIGHLPQLLALTTSVLMEKLGFQPQLKWPNDVLLGGKKVTGILCESIPLENKRGIILGIGININMPIDELQKIDRPATSLLVEGGKQLSVPQVIESLKEDFNDALQIFLKEGFASFWPHFERRSYYKRGDQIRFHDNQKIFEGYFDCLIPDGSVKLKTKDGTEKIFHAGEFVF